MPSRSSWLPIPVLALVVVVVGACGGTGSSGSAPDTPVTANPGAARSGGTVASAPPSAGPPSAGTSRAAEPPAASLSAEGGDPVVGQLGSYTWAGGGSDSPWLRGSPIRVGAGEPLTVTLAGDAAVDDWAVQRVAARTTDGRGAAAMGSGQEAPVAFLAPGAGSWSILVTLRFAGGSDTAAYYWLLDVR